MYPKHKNNGGSNEETQLANIPADSPSEEYEREKVASLLYRLRKEPYKANEG